MVRRCADWFVKAGASWFVVVCCGNVRHGGVRQGRWGMAWESEERFGELRQARYVAAGQVTVRCSSVRQVRRDKVGHGEVRQVGLGGARWS
jgi:hypothetical protein